MTNVILSGLVYLASWGPGYFAWPGGVRGGGGVWVSLPGQVGSGLLYLARWRLGWGLYVVIVDKQVKQVIKQKKRMVVADICQLRLIEPIPSGGYPSTAIIAPFKRISSELIAHTRLLVRDVDNSQRTPNPSLKVLGAITCQCLAWFCTRVDGLSYHPGPSLHTVLR